MSCNNAQKQQTRTGSQSCLTLQGLDLKLEFSILQLHYRKKTAWNGMHIRMWGAGPFLGHVFRLRSER